MEHAIQDFSRAIRLKPGSAITLGGRGYAYMRKGELDLALQDLSRAIEVKPDNPEAYFNRAAAYRKNGDAARAAADFASAIRGFTRAIELKPDEAWTYVERGSVYFQTNDLDRAIADFTRAIQLKPDDAEAYCKRGETCRKKGDWRQAIADLTKASALRPERPELCNSVAWFLATCPEDGLRDGTKALPAARKACDLTQWKNPAILDTLAAVYAELGQFDEAVKWQRKVLEDPEFTAKRGAPARARLQLYESGKPYRDAPPAPATNAVPATSEATGE